MNKTLKKWSDDVAEYEIVQVGDHTPYAEKGHPCGYCKFEKDPVRECGHDSILAYVPVHGGITYNEREYGKWIYGFDMAHGWETPELQGDIDYITAECEKMARCIVIAAKYETRYDEAYREESDYMAVVNEFLAECGE